MWIRLAVALCSLIVALVPAKKSSAFDAASDSLAAGLIRQSGATGGIIVHLGCGDGELTASLKVSEQFQVQGLDRDVAKVEAAREKIRAAGKYGTSAVDRLSGDALPYIENLVNLLIVDNASGIDREEMLRVLTPNGVAMIRQGNEWQKVVKPRTKKIDDWTHYLYDATGNAVAHDEVVGPPRHLQWLGSPRWSRHHDRMASMSALVSAAGRVFYIMDEGSRISIQMPPKWTLVARDAFNGTILWKQSIPTWHSHLWPLKSGPTQLARRLVATESTVFVTLGLEAPVTAIDAATGEIKHTFEQTASTEEVLHDNGTLYLLVNRQKLNLASYAPSNAVVGDQGQVGKEWTWNEQPREVMAVDARSGETRWSFDSKVSPLTLCADVERVFFHDGEKVVCLSKSTGKPVWQSAPASRRANITFNFGPRLVIHGSVLMYAGGDNKMKAFDSATGEVLWDAPHDRSGYQSPEDLLVVNNLVWSAPTTSGGDSGEFTGRDLRTGEVKVTFPPNVDPYWFHHRCYIAKATDKFIIPSRTGIEFVSPTETNWQINHWVRGGCLYGVMPCNGLLYAPPHNCACYPEAKLYGFNALAPASPDRLPPQDVPEDGRLEKGPAFGDATTSSGSAEDWPTYRHDEARSGQASTKVATEIGEAWKTDLGGRLSTVTVADGKVFVSSIDTHSVYALHAKSGEVVWRYTAGGRVDSPPTIDGGRAYFGCNDGWIYCVRASDGELVWRYRAAPVERRLVAFEQVESVWPVHGAVLVRNGSVFGVAGRSNFLDGGLRFLKLDAQSGSKLSEKIIDEKDPETGGNIQDRHQVLQMSVGLPDILSAQGENIFMKSQRLDQDGNRYELGPNSADFAGQAAVHAGEFAHVFAPMGFLDDEWFHRSYWVYGRSFAGGHAGYYQAGKFAPSGRILVFDDTSVYGFGRKPEHLRWTTVLEHQLFSAPKEAPEVPESAKKRQQPNRRGNAGASMVRITKSPKIDPTNKAVYVEAWVFAEKPNGVVVAHGGPLVGYSLYLRNGRPQFGARIESRLFDAAGRESIVRKWTHLAGALTKDGKVELYINGTLAATTKAPGLIANEPAQSIEIGADEGGAAGDYQSPAGFSGIIDEVQIMHGDFTSAELEKRFTQPSQPLQGKLVFASTFDGGKARDASGQENHGEIVKAVAADGRNGVGLRFASGPGGNGGGVPNTKPSWVEPHWTKDIPLLVRAMLKSEDALFLVGPPDFVDEVETFEKLKNRDEKVQELLSRQDAALLGAEGAILRVVSTRDGSTLKDYELKSLPVWDGLAAAQGRLYLATQDGSIVCFGAAR
jgi:outer membrane protein assembly factor BamB